MRRVAVFTGTRADWGLLAPLARLVHADPDLTLGVLVSGSHLSEAHGMTVAEIEAEGLPIAARAPLDLSDDTPAGICRALGQAAAGCGAALAAWAPDILVILGDRYEALAAAAAAAVCRVPVAHIHGGELSLGAMDDAFRHAITKLAHLHCTATQRARQRVIQLGEAPETVHWVGAPGVEAVLATPDPGPDAVAAFLGIEPGRPYFLATFHPPTLEPGAAQGQMAELLAALEAFPDHAAVLTKAGADTEGLGLGRQLDAHAAAHPERVRVFASLGQLRYVQAMRHCAAVVGNSSSGIIEAPSLHAPTVNLGGRQLGRERAESVLDCAPERAAVVQALRTALSPEFRARARAVENPYARPGTARAILGLLKAFPGGVRKTFHDLPVPPGGPA
ncbi:MAG: UDP-N-acetylglucosamine 2-epimerase [Desulfovibrionaceae bacterium]